MATSDSFPVSALCRAGLSHRSFTAISATPASGRGARNSGMGGSDFSTPPPRAQVNAKDLDVSRGFMAPGPIARPGPNLSPWNHWLEATSWHGCHDTNIRVLGD